MDFGFKVLNVLLLSVILLIPVSSLANAQEHQQNEVGSYYDYPYVEDSYYYDDNFNNDNNKKEYYSSSYNKHDYLNNKNNDQYYYDYIGQKEVDKEDFKKIVQECEECFFSELVKLDRKTADKVLYQIDKKFGSLTELCKLIAAEKIDREKLEKIIDHVLNSPEFVDKKKVKKFFKDFQTRSSTNYDLDEFKLKEDKRVDAKSLKEFKENVLECIFPPDNVYVTFLEHEDEIERDSFIAVSNDNGLTFNTLNLSIADPDGPTDANFISLPVVSERNVYVTWLENEDDATTKNDAFIAVSNDNGLTFNTINLSIADPDGPTDASSLNPPVVSGNNVYVTWTEDEDDTTDESDVFIAVSNDNGLTFNIINLSIADPDGPTDSGDLSPPVVSGNNVYVTWAEDEDDTTGEEDMFIAVSNDNGLTFNIINLSIADPDGPTDTDFPNLPVVSESNVYVTWLENEDDNINEDDAFIAVSNDNGLTFNTINLSIVDPDGPTDADDIDPPVISGNNVYVTWVEDEDDTTFENDAFIAVSNDNGLTFNTINLSIADPDGPTSASTLHLPVVSGSNVYVTWGEDEDDTTDDNDIFIAVSNDNGLTFNTINLSIADPDGPTDASFLSPPVVSGSNVYVTWGEDEDDTTDDNDAFIAVSNDNGLTFNTINLSIADPDGPTDASFLSPPVVSESNVYVTWLENEDDTTFENDAFIAVSNDNGLTFNTINLSIADPDGPTGANSISPPVVSESNVYVTWLENEDDNINEDDAFIAVSNDNGLTFNTINLSIVDPDGPTDANSISPPVVSESNVYVTWQEDEDDTTGEDDAFIAVSNDNSLTFNTINLSIADTDGFTDAGDVSVPVIS